MVFLVHSGLLISIYSNLWQFVGEVFVVCWLWTLFRFFFFVVHWVLLRSYSLYSIFPSLLRVNIVFYPAVSEACHIKRKLTTATSKNYCWFTFYVEEWLSCQSFLFSWAYNNLQDIQIVTFPFFHFISRYECDRTSHHKDASLLSLPFL